MTATTAPWLTPHTDWNLHMIDCQLPDLADVQGKTIAQLDLRAKFGCSVVGIERQGFMIPLPPADAVLYPRDKVLLLGTIEQVKAGKAFLGAVSGNPPGDSLFEEIRMEALPVSYAQPGVLKDARGNFAGADAWRAGRGINRGGIRILNREHTKSSVQAMSCSFWEPPSISWSSRAGWRRRSRLLQKT